MNITTRDLSKNRSDNFQTVFKITLDATTSGTHMILHNVADSIIGRCKLFIAYKRPASEQIIGDFKNLLVNMEYIRDYIGYISSFLIKGNLFTLELDRKSRNNPDLVTIELKMNISTILYAWLFDYKPDVLRPDEDLNIDDVNVEPTESSRTSESGSTEIEERANDSEC